MSFRSNIPLLWLIKNMGNKELKSFIEREKLYNAFDETKNTLLHYASEYGRLEILEFLIDSGSDVDACNDLKQTPLIKSLRTDLPCKKVVEFLLEAGTDIILQDNGFEGAVDIVSSVAWLKDDIRRFEILKIFLERTTNMTIFRKLWKGDENVIKSLLQTDINLSMADNFGRTIVHMLAENLNPGVIEQLHGTNFNVDVHDRYNQTPLLYAICKNNISAIEFLLNEGADVEAMTIHGFTPLYIAIRLRKTNSNTKRIVQVLLDHGANLQVQIYNFHLDYIETIFDFVSTDENFELAELLIANLVLQEALGMIVDDIISIKIHENCRLKSYFDNCQQELFAQIYPSISLFDVLTASERKLELYLHNEELALKLIDYQTSIYYFNTILHPRISKASRIIELRKIAAQIVCKLAKMDYSSYPFVFDKIIDYLEEENIENLISIQNLLF